MNCIATVSQPWGLFNPQSFSQHVAVLSARSSNHIIHSASAYIYCRGWQNLKIQRRYRTRSPPPVFITYPDKCYPVTSQWKSSCTRNWKKNMTGCSDVTGWDASAVKWRLQRYSHAWPSPEDSVNCRLLSASLLRNPEFCRRQHKSPPWDPTQSQFNPTQNLFHTLSGYPHIYAWSVLGRFNPQFLCALLVLPVLVMWLD